MSFYEDRKTIFQWLGASLIVCTAVYVVFFFGMCLFFSVYTKCGRRSKQMMCEKERYVRWEKRDNIEKSLVAVCKVLSRGPELSLSKMTENEKKTLKYFRSLDDKDMLLERLFPNGNISYPACLEKKKKFEAALVNIEKTSKDNK